MSKISKDIASWDQTKWQEGLQAEIDKSFKNIENSLLKLDYCNALYKFDEIETHLKKIDGYKIHNSNFSKFKNNSLNAALAKSETIPIEDIVKKQTKIIPENYNIEDEFSGWVEYCKKTNNKFEQTYGEGKIPTLLFKDFEITPHTYKDDTAVETFASGKSCMPCVVDYTFNSFDIGTYKTNQASKEAYFYRTKDWINKHLRVKTGDAAGRNGYGTLVTGATSDGRKILYFTTNFRMADLPNMDKRGSVKEPYMLISQGKEFTQAQKDVIRIFLDENNLKYMNESSFSPLQFSIAPNESFVENLDKKMSTANTKHTIHNKTAFFSAIQSWAKQSKEVDVDRILEQAGENLIIEKGKII